MKGTGGKKRERNYIGLAFDGLTARVGDRNKNVVRRGQPRRRRREESRVKQNRDQKREKPELRNQRRRKRGRENGAVTISEVIWERRVRVKTRASSH